MSESRKKRRDLRRGLYVPRQHPTGNTGGMRHWPLEECDFGSIKNHPEHADQVHMILKVGALNHPVIVKLENPQQADQLIAALELHRFDVWPELTHPIDDSPEGQRIAQEAVSESIRQLGRQWVEEERKRLEAFAAFVIERFRTDTAELGDPPWNMAQHDTPVQLIESFQKWTQANAEAEARNRQAGKPETGQPGTGTG